MRKIKDLNRIGFWLEHLKVLMSLSEWRHKDCVSVPFVEVKCSTLEFFLLKLLLFIDLVCVHVCMLKNNVQCLSTLWISPGDRTQIIRLSSKYLSSLLSYHAGPRKDFLVLKSLWILVWCYPFGQSEQVWGLFLSIKVRNALVTRTARFYSAQSLAPQTEVVITSPAVKA